MHEAFFFGPSQRQLFAVYHPPIGADSNVLTIICPPLLAELNSTYSLLVKLARSLAEQGQHVLRMDYSGTGDSFGQLEEVSVPDWTKDIELAIQEGRELTGCSTIRVLAVRASTLIVCKAIGARDDIDRLVFWDPITDGAQYLQSLMREQMTVLERHHYLTRAEYSELMSEYGMFHLSDRMLEDIRSLDPSMFSCLPMDKVVVICTSPEVESPLPGASFKLVEFDCNWEAISDGLIISQPLLEALALCLTKK